MKKFISMIAALVFAALSISAHAEAVWRNFGADKAYDSREAAIADAPRVLRQVGLNEPLVALFIEAMKNPGTPTHVTNRMRFDFMRSGRVALWRNVRVDFSKPPIAESMEYSAPSEEWTVEHEGVRWTIGLPDVCRNLYGKKQSVSAPVTADTPPGVNVIPLQPLVAVPQLTPPMRKIAACPNTYFLTINAWPSAAFDFPGVRETHAIEELGAKKFSLTERVSRKHGGQLRAALAKGKLARLTTPIAFRVSLIKTSEAEGGYADYWAEEVLGDVDVTGVYELQFTPEQLQSSDAIRLVVIDGNVTSPPRNPTTGVREVRFFNHLPKTKLGEWDSNPDPDCAMNVHVIQ